MISSIMQPTFFPWVGYFDMIDQSDVFVFLDDVQLSKQSWQTRNKIKTQQGQLLLSIPFEGNGKHRERLINETKTADRLNWKKKHLKTIEQSYRKAPYFIEVFEFLENCYSLPNQILSEFNTSIIKGISEKIGIKSHFINSSEIALINNEKENRLIEICNKIGADNYLSPKGSSVYLNQEKVGGVFSENDQINLYYHNYESIKYPQLYGEFISHLGIIDLIFNAGFKQSLSWIKKGRKSMIHFKQLANEF